MLTRLQCEKRTMASVCNDRLAHLSQVCQPLTHLWMRNVEKMDVIEFSDMSLHNSIKMRPFEMKEIVLMCLTIKKC